MAPADRNWTSFLGLTDFVMMTSPTLTPQEFSDLHNALCEISSIQRTLSEFVNEKTSARFSRAVEKAYAAISRAHREEDALQDSRSASAMRIAEANGFKSIWSMFEVSDFSAVRFPRAKFVEYCGKRRAIEGEGNWVDVWRAADALMEESGDTHHVFIESFHPIEDETVLQLGTGS
jgi:hypothetical protein